VNARVTKGNVNKLLQMPQMRQLFAKEGWKAKNHDQLMNNLPPDEIPMEWHQTSFTVDGVDCDLYHQDILQVIQFLISHKPFQSHLRYAPYREYNDEDKRVFTHPATATHWWDLQNRLPDGATAVPIQWFSDKTVLSQQRGDKKVWPVYITIMNLSNHIRHGGSRLGLLPVALIPIVHGKHRLQQKVYHKAMEIVFNCKSSVTSTLLKLTKSYRSS